MSLKIKNPKRFLISLIVTLLLLLFVIVGFFTVMGKIIGLFTKKDEPQATPEPTATAQAATPAPSAPPTPAAPTVDPSNLGDIQVLVNKTHELPSDYEPSDLVTVPLRGSRETQLRQQASDALVKLFAAADSDGVTLYCASGYRSYSMQEDLFAENVAAYGEEQANLVSAKPGQSEHQTGLCMDLTCESMGMDLQESFADTAEGQWIANNAQNYGFIIRFPEGKTDITGYSYEPWHIRYVGVDAAKEIHSKNETFEEYLGQTN